MSSNPFRTSGRVPIWLPPAIFGAVAVGLCASLASGDASFMDLRPLMYIAIAVLWAGASSAWFVLAGLLRADRIQQALEDDEAVVSAAAPPSLPEIPSAGRAPSRASRIGGRGLYVGLSFALFLALPVIDSGISAQQVDGDTMRTVHWFEVVAVLNLLAASIAFARARRKS